MRSVIVVAVLAAFVCADETGTLSPKAAWVKLQKDMQTARMNRDRKAFEAANKVQEELASVNEAIESRHGELAELDARSSEKRQELRDIAQRILLLADDGSAAASAVDDAEVVDLRAQPADLA